MAHDEGLAELMREDMSALEGLEEKRMFGGICFMHRGHMLCGVHKDGAMYRVGKVHHEAALAMDGVGPMTMTGRPMGGLVDVDPDAMGDDALRTQLLKLSLDFTASLPAK